MSRLDGQNPQGARLLVVDDDPHVIHMFSVLLRDEGFEVLTGSQGADAVTKARADSPDLILLDVQLPDLDGYEATRRLKSDPVTRGIPVILITGHDDPQNKVRGLEAGADEFLAKPLDRAELLVRIRSMLRLRNYQEQLQNRLLSDAADRAALEAAETGVPGPRTVSVALDDGAERSLVSSSLAEAGYKVGVITIAGQDRQAIESIDSDLVIVDSSVPPDLLSAVKIPTLALVPPSDPNLRVSLLDRGVSELLVRPFDPREMALRVSRLIAQKAALSSLEKRYRTALSAASSDSMTKLSNHGYFRKFLDLEVKRSKRQKHPTSLIMLDIDDFKSKNDVFGHATGDIILIKAAERIRQSVREIDLAARYGGEEFAVVLPYTDRAGAAVVAERIRAAIADVRFADGAPLRGLTVTVSLGVAVCPDDAASPEELIRLADELLYKAKESGKNRVCSGP